MTPPLRVAFVYPHAAIGPSGEGVPDALAVVLLELGRELVRRGCGVDAFVRRRSGEPPTSRLDGLTIHRLRRAGDHLLFRLRLLDPLLPADRLLELYRRHRPRATASRAARCASPW